MIYRILWFGWKPNLRISSRIGFLIVELGFPSSNQLPAWSTIFTGFPDFNLQILLSDHAYRFLLMSLDFIQIFFVCQISIWLSCIWLSCIWLSCIWLSYSVLHSWVKCCQDVNHVLSLCYYYVLCRFFDTQVVKRQSGRKKDFAKKKNIVD